MIKAMAFLRDERGAVTVDWVVLTAGIVGLAVAAVGFAEDGIAGLGVTIKAALMSIPI